MVFKGIDKLNLLLLIQPGNFLVNYQDFQFKPDLNLKFLVKTLY